jgi:hypothetical protein
MYFLLKCLCLYLWQSFCLSVSLLSFWLSISRLEMDIILRSSILALQLPEITKDLSNGSEILIVSVFFICLSFCLTFCLPIFLSLCLSVFMSFCFSVFLSICLSDCPSHVRDGYHLALEDSGITTSGDYKGSFLRRWDFNGICVFVYLSTCLSVFLFFCLSVFLSVCFSVFLSFRLSVYLSICLSDCLSQHWRRASSCTLGFWC